MTTNIELYKNTFSLLWYFELIHLNDTYLVYYNTKNNYLYIPYAKISIIDNAILTLRVDGYALDSWLIEHATITREVVRVIEYKKLKTNGFLESYDIEITKYNNELVEHICLNFHKNPTTYTILSPSEFFIDYIKKDYRYFFLALAKNSLHEYHSMPFH